MKRVVSGMRPTGKMHFGNYFGAVKNWIDLQDKYDCYYFIADWHALTSHYDSSKEVRSWIIDMVKDLIASGLDPKKSVLFLQSEVKEHAELYLLFSMFTSVPRLERVPTYKDIKNQLEGERDLANLGFLGYPVLQTADILIYRGEYVPVGKDQEYHIELAREIARKFNSLYDKVFPEPKALFTPTTLLLGLDGRKMSKSYNNTLELNIPFSEVKKKILPMKTDINRKRKTDPGDPEKCPVWGFHKLFDNDDELSLIQDSCTNAKFGCIDCKKILLNNLEKFYSEFHERRSKLTDDYIRDIIIQGSNKAREEAKKTLELVREAMGWKNL
jgi:tryptophanyl-tRNA synthetase